MKNEFCDGKCESCTVLNSNNVNMVYRMLQDWVLEGKIDERDVNEYCPNLTVCPKCHVDDFVHVEGCDND